MADLVFEKLTQAYAVGQRVPLQIAGNFFRLSVANYPVSVSFVVNSRVIGTMQNMLAGDYLEGVEFDGVIVTNGVTAQRVTVQIAGGGAGSDRVLGEVSVIDGGKARSLANIAFWDKSSSAVLAGNYSHSQLWNPAGSGKNLMVTQFSVVSATPNSFGFGFYDAPLSSLDVTQPVSKNNGIMGISVASTRNQQNTSVLVTRNCGSLTSPALVMQLYKLTEPIIVQPASGLVIWAGAAGTDIICNFEHFEEAI